MHGFAYGASLLLSLTGMALIDYRWKLVAAVSLRATLGTCAMGVAGFLAWDWLCISQGIFFRGTGPWQSGLLVAPEIPVEEVLFLTFLVYCTLIIHAAARQFVARWSRQRVRWGLGVIGLLLVLAIALSSRWHGGAVYGIHIVLVLLPVVIAACLGAGRGWDWLATATTMATIFVLTAVFDSFLIGVGIVGYDWSLTSGIRIGIAPIEDFGYAVASVLCAPVVWHRWKENNAQ